MPVGIDKASAVEPRKIRTTSASDTFNLAADDILLVDASAADIAVTLPTPPATGHNRVVTIKRIDSTADRFVLVQAAGGIDNDDTNIALTPTAQGGINSGESVDLIWDETAAEWRVLGSLQNTQAQDTQTNLVWEGSRTVTSNSVNWTGRAMVIGKGFQPAGGIDQFIAMVMPAVGTAIPVSTGGTRAVTATGILLNSYESLYYRFNPNSTGGNNAGGEGFIVVPYNDNYRDNELAVWLATNVGNVRVVWGDYQIGSDPAVAADFWRGSGGLVELPDGTNDEIQNINRRGKVGIGQNVPAFEPVATLDVAAGNRSGTDGRIASTPLYVTGGLPGMPSAAVVANTPVGGVEVRHANQSQGIGIAFDGIYATGSTANQNISIMNRGAGQIDIKHQDIGVGGIAYLNFATSAISGSGGWHDRWWGNSSQEWGVLTRRSPNGSGLGVQRFWQGKDANGTLRNAMLLTPSPSTLSHRLHVNLSNQFDAHALVLYGDSNSVSNIDKFSIGIDPNAMRYNVGNTGNEHRWYHGTTQTMGLSGARLTLNASVAEKVGGGAWSAVSDSRMKENITAYTKGLDAICDLQVKSFKYKSAAGYGAATHVGLVAQDVSGDGWPELLTSRPATANEAAAGATGTVYGVDPSPILWALVNAVCDLKDLIDSNSASASGCPPTIVGLNTYAPTSNVNNQSAPQGGVGFRFTGTDDIDITGLVAASSGTCVQFHNSSDKTLDFKDNDSGSTAANRFACPEGSDYNLKPGNHITWQYDGSVSRWVTVSTGENE